MNEQYISIESHHNPIPHTQKNFTVQFLYLSVHTIVTFTPSVVRSWPYRTLHLHRCRRHKLVVGLGVQWRHSSSIPPPPTPTSRCTSTLHCRQCLIFQLLHTNSVPLVLRRFLNEPHVTFVGVWSYSDEAMLTRSKHRLSVSRIVDVRDVAVERKGLRKKVSMEKLAEVLLDAHDVKKPKWLGRSAWDACSLIREQVQYACVDTLISFLLGKELTAWNWN